MRKFLLAFVAILLLTGCAKKAEYNKNLEVTEATTDFSLQNPLQKAYIYIDKTKMGKESFKSSSSLGEDKLDIDLGLYTMEGSQRFFKNYLRNLEPTNNNTVLSSHDLIIIPEITTFSYGFYSPDGFNVDAKPFVSYGLNLTIYKNGKEIFRKNISTKESHYGELTFFGMGTTSYGQIGPLLQKAIAEDYNLNAKEILTSINSK